MAAFDASGAHAALAFDWSTDTRTFVSEVLAMFDGDTTDTAMLAQLRQLKQDVHALALGRETDARRVIQELQERITVVDDKRSEVLPSIEEVKSRIGVFEAQKAKLIGELERMRAAKDASAASLQSLTQQMTALKHASQTLMADHTATVPRVKHSLSLYATISNIRWDYDATDAVAGYIAPPDGAPVRPFHVDPRFNTPKEVADKLWDAIGAATGLTAVGGVLAVGGSGSR